MKKTKPIKVVLINGNPLNGKLGVIATPFETDAHEWLANGWQRKTETPAQGGNDK